MGWRGVEERIGKAFSSYFVSCETREDERAIMEAIKEEFPEIDERKIEKGIKDCCESLSVPRARHRFLDCLRRVLR